LSGTVGDGGRAEKEGEKRGEMRGDLAELLKKKK
jgi:hypothetical protein